MSIILFFKILFSKDQWLIIQLEKNIDYFYEEIISLEDLFKSDIELIINFNDVSVK